MTKKTDKDFEDMKAQIRKEYGYDNMSPEEKKAFDEKLDKAAEVKKQEYKEKGLYEETKKDGDNGDDDDNTEPNADRGIKTNTDSKVKPKENDDTQAKKPDNSYNDARSRQQAYEQALREQEKEEQEKKDKEESEKSEGYSR